GVNPGGDIAQHFLGDIQAPQFGERLLLLEDTSEASLAATHVEHAPAGQIPQMLVDELDVIDPWIDGGREVLLVTRGFVEGGLYAGAQLRGEPRAGLSGKQPLPVQLKPSSRIVPARGDRSLTVAAPMKVAICFKHTNLCPRQEDRQADFLFVDGAV